MLGCSGGSGHGREDLNVRSEMTKTKRRRVTRKVLVLLGSLFSLALTCYLLFALYQKPRDQIWVTTEILPLVEYVEQFREERGRLPSEEEFRIWSDSEYENQLTNYFPTKPDFVRDWGELGHDFIVGRWRGEWVHYYSTWDKRNFSDPTRPWF